MIPGTCGIASGMNRGKATVAKEIGFLIGGTRDHPGSARRATLIVGVRA